MNQDPNLISTGEMREKFHSRIKIFMNDESQPNYNKLSRGEICVANFILPCEWGESG